MLYKVTMPDESIVLVKEEEFIELKEALEYMNLTYKAVVVEDKMYCIHWFDYIDNVWATEWKTEEAFQPFLREIIDAEVEYFVEEFN